MMFPQSIIHSRWTKLQSYFGKEQNFFSTELILSNMIHIYILLTNILVMNDGFIDIYLFLNIFLSIYSILRHHVSNYTLLYRILDNGVKYVFR